MRGTAQSLPALVGVLLLAGSLGLSVEHAPQPTSVGRRIADYLGLQAEMAGLDAGPVAAEPCPTLEEALAHHFAYFGRPIPAPPTIADARLAAALACLLDALADADALRDEAFQGVDLAELATYIGSETALPSGMESVDGAKMVAAARRVAVALDATLPLLSQVPLAGTPIDLPPVLYVDTLGVSNTHTLDYALTVELGGDDIYANSAGGAIVAMGSELVPGPGVVGNESTYQHVVSLPLGLLDVVVGGAFEDADLILASTLVLDLAGDDTYGVKETPNVDATCTAEPVVRRVGIQGTGVGSVGMLVDLAGANQLTAKTLAQGVGHLGGVGVLYLGPGDDRLEAVRSSQGSGILGGHGLLLNEAGDDVYVASAPEGGVFNGDNGLCDAEPRYAQGSGFGRVIGVPPGPGVTGGLVDEAGNDRYTSVAKSMGHGQFGAGYLIDHAGDDRYEATDKSLAFGSGSADTGGAGLGAFIDLSGTDTYVLTGAKGLGYGNGELKPDVAPPSTPPQNWLNHVLDENIRPLVPASTALFWEESGTDVYVLGQTTRANGAAETHGALGVFVDRA
jgi:hypothetical protein